MPTWGWLMIGVPKRLPKTPGFVIVKVPPWTSSTLSFLARARSARSFTARARPRTFFSSALWITGTMRPQSRATAMPEVDVLLVDDGVAVDAGVQDREGLERVDRGLEDERHVGELDAAPLLVGGAVLLAQLVDARHVDLEDGGDVGRGALREHHVLGRLPADGRHRHDFDAAAGPRAARGRRGGEGGGRLEHGRAPHGGGRRRTARAAASMWPRMSCFVTRPPMPVPGISRMSTCARPRSCARPATSGCGAAPRPSSRRAASRLAAAWRQRAAAARPRCWNSTGGGGGAARRRPAAAERAREAAAGAAA